MTSMTLRVPPDIRAWLEAKRRTLGERSINSTIVRLLDAAREQEKAA